MITISPPTTPTLASLTPHPGPTPTRGMDFATIVALGDRIANPTSALAFSETGIFGRTAPTSVENAPVKPLPPVVLSKSPTQSAPNITQAASIATAASRPTSAHSLPKAQNSKWPLDHRANNKPVAGAPQDSVSLGRAPKPNPTERTSNAGAPMRAAALRKAQVRTAAHANAMSVAFHESGRAAEVIARVGRMAPTERARLRQAIANLLARHGYYNASLSLAE